MASNTTNRDSPHFLSLSSFLLFYFLSFSFPLFPRSCFLRSSFLINRTKGKLPLHRKLLRFPYENLISAFFQSSFLSLFVFTSFLLSCFPLFSFPLFRGCLICSTFDLFDKGEIVILLKVIEILLWKFN